MTVIEESQYAPIALFAYNRLDHLKKTVDALIANDGALNSELYIFSDGPKGSEDIAHVRDVREFVSTVEGFKRVHVVVQDKNIGLAESIITGVSQIVEEQGKVIVLEDDMVTSPSFLSYMNQSLLRYEQEKKVWHISGWNYPINNVDENYAFLWRGMNCWGWATWKDRWGHFSKDPDKLMKLFTMRDKFGFNLNGTQNFWSQVTDNHKGIRNTWAVFWYATIFLHDGLCLNPSSTYVQNTGVDGTGTNCGDFDDYRSSLNFSDEVKFQGKVQENRKYLMKIMGFNLKRKLSPLNLGK